METAYIQSVINPNQEKDKHIYLSFPSADRNKLDFQRPLFKNSDNPVDLDLFVDVGTVFDNKNTPNNSEESIRSSYGFGIKFYHDDTYEQMENINTLIHKTKNESKE